MVISQKSKVFHPQPLEAWVTEVDFEEKKERKTKGRRSTEGKVHREET